jgi:hypothetical protein
LTDEEYDILDLPKDASVGDRASGLLEICYNHPDIADEICDGAYQLSKEEACPLGDTGRIFPVYQHVEYVFGRTE